MKKLLALTLVAVMLLTACFSFTSCNNGKDDGKFTIGICQLLDHDALNAATKGFIDAVTSELGEENVEIIFRDAQGEPTLCTTIVNDFVAKEVDMIMANATPALQAAAGATMDIPILGTSITEYGVALEIDNFAGVVGGNISGTSDLAPLAGQAEMILEICHDISSVAIVYCASEANSKYQVEEMTKLLTAKNITVEAFAFTDSNDIQAVVNAACAACDVLYIPTDNTAASCADTIGNVVRDTMTPVFAGEENVAKKCGVATLTISYYDLGVTTGKMAAKILKGEADISTMKIENAPATKKYNAEMCAYLGIEIPEGYIAIN